MTVIEIFKVFSSLFDGGSGIFILLETTLDESGILTVDDELTVDVVLIVLSGLLSEIDTVFSEELEAAGLLDELTEPEYFFVGYEYLKSVAV